MKFKNNKVWMAIDSDGQAIYQHNKVLIKYQLDQDYEYWVHGNGVTNLPESETEVSRAETPISSKSDPNDKPRVQQRLVGDEKEEGEEKPGVVYMYTDGACSGNPGPAGIGVLLRYNGHEKEISRNIGTATNNIAELQAVLAGLEQIRKPHLPVRIFTDSKYVYGVLVLGWKAKKNKELIHSILKKLNDFPNLRIIKVKGHAGHEGNERADYLATSAINADPDAG